MGRTGVVGRGRDAASSSSVRLLLHLFVNSLVLVGLSSVFSSEASHRGLAPSGQAILILLNSLALLGLSSAVSKVQCSILPPPTH